MRALVLILLLAVAAACSPSVPPGPAYPDKIASERADKDAMFRNDPRDSPIKPGEMELFVPLSYFPIDESYAVPAQLQPAAERITAEMPTSTGTIRQMTRLGTLVFTLKGQPLKLAAFAEGNSPQLFVPFSDLTSGAETYQAGRYMNLAPTPTGIYIVDFNIAYQPYCYYNAEYECPLPPRENRLAVPIRAGEKLRKEDSMVPR